MKGLAPALSLPLSLSLSLPLSQESVGTERHSLQTEQGYGPVFPLRLGDSARSRHDLHPMTSLPLSDMF